MANTKSERQKLIDRMRYVEDFTGKENHCYRVVYDNNYYYANDTHALAEKVLREMKNNPSIT